MNKLAIIVPCYNEEAIIETTIKKLKEKLDELINNNQIDKNSFIVFVDDGSKDNTWRIINSQISNNIKGLKLSKNFGQQNAILAGLLSFDADIYITIDADLQDDIHVMNEMIEKYYNGCEVVYGVRKSRKNDSFFKRYSAESFYKFMKILGVEIVFNHADYRLMSKKIIENLKEFKEVNLFLRGIIPAIGFKSCKVYYDRLARSAGESKYPLKKMLSFAWDGITSFSIKPLRIISLIGFFVFIISLIIGIWALWEKFICRNTVAGWTSTIISLYFLGGIQLLSLGVIGEYIGKIYQETKKRPRFIIEDKKEWFFVFNL